MAEFDTNLFRSESPNFITQDEESSGIIDTSAFLGAGTFVFDAQIHTPSGNPATVELGQLLTMRITDFSKVYDIDGDPGPPAQGGA